MQRLRRRPASRPCFAAASAAVFFIYIVYFFSLGRSKLEHLIRFATEKTPPTFVFPRKRPGTQLAITVGYIESMCSPQRTNKRGDK
jgi:hypothetical protein